MSGTLRRWLRRGVVALLALALFAPASARASDEPQPPFDVQGLEHRKVWVPWVFAFLFAAGCIAIGLKNPHRTHLD